MRATTIKIEDPLLRNLMPLIPSDQSLSAFVRKVLEREIRKHAMAQAAVTYAQFLESHPQENEWLESWEGADLHTVPKKESLSRKKKP